MNWGPVIASLAALGGAAAAWIRTETHIRQAAAAAGRPAPTVAELLDGVSSADLLAELERRGTIRRPTTLAAPGSAPAGG